MEKRAGGGVRYVAVVLVFVGLVATNVQSRVGLGAGVAAGIEFPIGQEDQRRGPVYGLKGRVCPYPTIIIEPNLYFIRLGDPQFEEFTSDLEGADITSFGINLAFGTTMGGTGVKPYGLLGAGFYNVSQDQIGKDETDLGWSAGFGIEVGVARQVGLDVRGRAIVIPTDGGGSKKSGAVMGGINVYLGN